MEIIHNWGFLALKVDSPDTALSRDDVMGVLSKHPFMTGLLEDPTLESSCALINGEMVMSKLHLGVAVMRLRQVLQHAKLQALLNIESAPLMKMIESPPTKRLPLTSLLGNLRTKRLPSEMLLMLSPTRNISVAMQQFSFIEKLPIVEESTTEGEALPATTTTTLSSSSRTNSNTTKRKPAVVLAGANTSKSVVFILGMYKPPQHVISHLLDKKVRPFLRDPRGVVPEAAKSSAAGAKRTREESSASELLIEVLSLSDLHKHCDQTAIRSVYNVTAQEERAVASRPPPDVFEGELLQRFASVSPVSPNQGGKFPAASSPPSSTTMKTVASLLPRIGGLEGAVLNRIASCDV